jgi:hypothetical protein
MPDQLDPSLDELMWQRLAMADLPPPPSDPAFKRPADPLRPQPMKRGGVSGTGSGMKYGTPVPPPASVRDWAPVPSDPNAFVGAAARRRTGPPTDLRTLRGVLAPEDMARMRTMIDKGMTQQQIAEAFGIGRSNVGRKSRAMQEKGEVNPPERIPGSGNVKPSMPQFNFKPPNFESDPKEINDYLKALEKHLNDVKAYFNAGPTRSFA